MGTLDKCFDTFIYTESISSSMDAREIGARFGGLPLVILGLVDIVLILTGSISASREFQELLLRVGFGVLLIGLLLLFLFSVRSVPQDLSFSFMLTQGRNIGRLINALNLEGKGIYFPPVGRLNEDRVYIPLEKRDLPPPDISDVSVFDVGSTGPSMGISLLPPGKGFVDRIEQLTTQPFSKETPMNGTEALEKLSKGSGLMRSLELTDRGERLELEILHNRNDTICSTLWKEYPDLHSKVGCPLCSAALTASARITGAPLRVISVEHDRSRVKYVLERVIG